MGLGLWLTESLIYNRENGELLTNRTWNYKPPGAKDIPIDFRIKLLHQNSYNPDLILGTKGTFFFLSTGIFKKKYSYFSRW